MKEEPETGAADTIRVVQSVVLAQTEIERIISCPVTCEIFHTPVILIGSGYTVEKEIALQLLSSDKPLCPITQLAITSFEVNRGMLDLVRYYLTSYPDACSEQYNPKNSTDYAPKIQVALENNNNQEIGAQAATLSELPAQPPQCAPNLPSAVGNAQGSNVDIQALVRHRAEIRPNNDVHRLPVAAMIVPSPPQNVNLERDEEMLLKLFCFANESGQRKHFIEQFSGHESGPFQFNLGLEFKTVKVGYSRISIWNTVGQLPFQNILRTYCRDSHIVFIFANEALDDLDRWLRVCNESLNYPQLYWIDSTAAVGQRFVACQELPLESIRQNRFPALSEFHYKQVAKGLLEEATKLVLRNVNVIVKGGDPEQLPPPPAASDGGGCRVM